MTHYHHHFDTQALKLLAEQAPAGKRRATDAIIEKALAHFKANGLTTADNFDAEADRLFREVGCQRDDPELSDLMEACASAAEIGIEDVALLKAYHMHGSYIGMFGAA